MTPGPCSTWKIRSPAGDCHMFKRRKFTFNPSQPVIKNHKWMLNFVMFLHLPRWSCGISLCAHVRGCCDEYQTGLRQPTALSRPRGWAPETGAAGRCLPGALLSCPCVLTWLSSVPVSALISSSYKDKQSDQATPMSLFDLTVSLRTCLHFLIVVKYT